MHKSNLRGASPPLFIITTSTPSTRRQFDGVALWFIITNAPDWLIYAQVDCTGDGRETPDHEPGSGVQVAGCAADFASVGDLRAAVRKSNSSASTTSLTDCFPHRRAEYFPRTDVRLGGDIVDVSLLRNGEVNKDYNPYHVEGFAGAPWAGIAYGAVRKSNCRCASPLLLNRDLHAIDATPARWRGVGVYYRLVYATHSWI